MGYPQRLTRQNRLNRMTELKEKFVERHKHYVEATEEIFQLFPQTIQAIVEYSELTKEYEDGRLKFDDVSLVVDDGIEYLLIIAILRYSAGDTIVTPHGLLEVTEKTARQLFRNIRVVIPAALATTDNRDEVSAFLKKEAATDAEHVSEELHTALAEQQVASDFDLDQLTKEQRTSLILPQMRRVH